MQSTFKGGETAVNYIIYSMLSYSSSSRIGKEALHTGHSSLTFIHWLRHSWWNMWSQGVICTQRRQ